MKPTSSFARTIVWALLATVTSEISAEIWHAELLSPGGPLPFQLEIHEGERPSAFVINGEERVPFSHVKSLNHQLTLAWNWYDSRIVAELDTSNISTASTMKGTWTKTSPRGAQSTLEFRATRGERPRFALPEKQTDPKPAADITGDWIVTFVDQGGRESAVGQFVQTGRNVVGTFLTRTGDYRFLVGAMDGSELKLSTFDGAHAFLFKATREQVDGVGEQLRGDFWSRDSYHATWTARRATSEEEVDQTLPDEWKMVQPTAENRRLRFRFPDTNGQMVDASDERFDGKVVLVNIFGSWCPNCNDEAPLLANWYRKYRERGLEIVGIGFEFSGDPERDTKMLRRFADRHGAEYPILLGGISDKASAAKALPDISNVIAFPQTIFIGRDGKVAHIHTGFSGPGTGNRYERNIELMEDRIRDLLAQ